MTTNNTLAERGEPALPADLQEPLRAWSFNTMLECSHPADGGTRLAIGGAVLDLRDLERLLDWMAAKYLLAPNERGGVAVAHDWLTAPAIGLEEAIRRFKADLPGWWFSVGECQVSCDASCAPTRDSEHIALVGTDEPFDSGFMVDLAQPSTLAEALNAVREEAIDAIQAVAPFGTGATNARVGEPTTQGNKP